MENYHVFLHLAIDSKLTGCDMVDLKISDITQGKTIQSRAIIVKLKTGLPVQFELTETLVNQFKLWLHIFN